MPCRDYESDHMSHGYDDDDVRILKDKADDLTRFLCAILTEVHSNGSFEDYEIAEIDDLAEWWENHKRLDAEAKDSRVTKLKNAGFDSKEIDSIIQVLDDDEDEEW